MTDPTTPEPQAALYMRKPKIHAAFQVSRENIEEVASWCQGVIFEPGTDRAYIRVPTNNPGQQRSRFEAQLGQWIMKTGRNFSVYTQRYIDSEFVIIPTEDTDLGNAVQMTTRVISDEEDSEEIPEQHEHHCCQHNKPASNAPNAPTPKKFHSNRHRR